MQNFQRVSEAQASAGHKARGVISGVGKGIMGVFTKPIGGAAELVSQTGYGEFLYFQHPFEFEKALQIQPAMSYLSSSVTA